MIDCSSLSSTVREFHAKMPIDTCTPYVHVTSHISSSINKSQSKALPTCNIRLTTTTQLSCPLCSSRSIASYNRTQPPFPPTHSLTLSVPRNPLQERRKKSDLVREGPCRSTPSLVLFLPSSFCRSLWSFPWPLDAYEGGVKQLFYPVSCRFHLGPDGHEGPRGCEL